MQSYLVRWVNAKGGHTISWSIKPDKKSINFGIFKHPGSDLSSTPKLPSSAFDVATPVLSQEETFKDPASSRLPSSTVADKLRSFGLKSISWYGSCEANKVSTGQYDVPKDEGGMFALVFDNTFSKQTSKKTTFVLLTYPTDAPPQSIHDRHVQGISNESYLSLRDPSKNRSKVSQVDSTEAVKRVGTGSTDRARDSDEQKTKALNEGGRASGSDDFFTGILQKRRRKKHQGWARRFFSLNFSTATLSYYHDRNDYALRGTVPLLVAAIGANGKTRQISIDSGAEIWHLKALNDKDFHAWKQALELARSPIDRQSPITTPKLERRGRSFSIVRSSPEDERDWLRIESLLTRIEHSRDLARNIAKDTDPKYLPLSSPNPISMDKLDPSLTSAASSNSDSPADQNINGYFNMDGGNDRRPFWKRKPSSERPMPGMFKRSVSATPAITPQRSAPPTPSTLPSTTMLQPFPEENVHEHSMTLLRDLDVIVADFAKVLQDSKKRRNPTLAPTVSRQSLESQDADEFFDAEGFDSSQLLDIEGESGSEEAGTSREEEDSGSDSEYDEAGSISRKRSVSVAGGKAFPSRPDNLSPLPTDRVRRRTTISAPTVPPPSLIGFFRKNVGKDLSTISMPVSANEPISLVQRLAECLEYSQLLDSAAGTSDSIERLLHVSAFAISMLSSSRAKERAVRKPFTSLLGETFELVREDRGFRFLAEKVSHRPLRLACQAESRDWSFTQSPCPTQKFWGKSAEIITEGKFRVSLHSTGDHFSWCPANTFLRNIIAGEKYVEPVGTMDIVNETTRERTVVSFKSKGMFSGRLEDVIVQAYDSHDQELPLGLAGKWTHSLLPTENGCITPQTPPMWAVGDLVPNANKHYGFTTFAAGLNEITSIEEGKLPPTDTRLRPDQREYEAGDLDGAERLKTILEEAQRARRKILEESGEAFHSRWFRRLEIPDPNGEEIWVAKSGSESYWDKRKHEDWKGIRHIFDVGHDFPKS